MAIPADITAVAHIRCPASLRELLAWVVWRYEPNTNPGGKPRKVPYYAAAGRRQGQHGSPSDRAQLVTFDAARAAAARRKMDGVGFCLLPEFGIVALDFDDCIVDGEPHPDLLNIVAATYAEYSPSGRGIRALYVGQLGNLKSHGTPYGLEIFSSKGYVTITGNTLPIVDILGHEDTIAKLDETALELINARFKKSNEHAENANTTPLGVTPSTLQRALDALPSDLDYDTWLQVGMALQHELGSDGFGMWDSWSQLSAKYTTRDYGWERWRSFGRNDGNPITARTLIHLANQHGAKISLNGPASVEEFEAVRTVPENRECRFAPIPVVEFSKRAAPEWIIKHVIPRAELVVLFGESGSGKSFIALQLAIHIATGQPWRGLRTKQGRVVYVAAEGAGGLRNRCIAYSIGENVRLDDVTSLDIISDVPNILLKDDALALAKAIGSASVVILDTFAQVTPGGNENSGEDVGKALAHCKGIHRATGATVVLVHHSGKDTSKGARGWSGLRAAADAELECSRHPGGRLLRVSKQKDGDDDLAWGFGLNIVNIGTDEDGEPITSCIVSEQPIPSASGPARVLGPKEHIVNDIIQEFAKCQLAGIEIEAVIQEALRRSAKPEGKRDTRRQHFRRAIESLCRGDDAPYFLDYDGTLSIA